MDQIQEGAQTILSLITFNQTINHKESRTKVYICSSYHKDSCTNFIPISVSISSLCPTISKVPASGASKIQRSIAIEVIGYLHSTTVKITHLLHF